MGILGELSKATDTTKIRVIEGDIPKGEWLFNGHGMVYVESKNGNCCDGDVETAATAESSSKICIALLNNVKVQPRKAGESHVITQTVTNMTPLYGTIFGLQFLGGFGAIAGFAAGSLLRKNDASFDCELSDGRKFFCIADYSIYKRIQQIAIADN